MKIFEKGLSYNFIIERIAEAKGNYYYVIQVEHKECWIRMYPFEIYQGSKKNIIRCEYRGMDSFGSHIFVEDKLSILYELYEENKEYEFRYVKDSVDTEGELCSILKDEYGLTHCLYEPLTSEQKDKKNLKCVVTSFNKTKKMLTLHLINRANTNYLIENNSTDKKVTTIEWMDAETLFKMIGKEHLLNEFFYEVQNVAIYGSSESDFIKLYQERNKEWIKHYLNYLDRRYKYILIQSENLEKLREFANLMIELIYQIIACQGKLVAKQFPKLNKYEGFKKAIDILLIGTLNDFYKRLSQTGDYLSEMTTLFGLFEVDRDFFGSHFSLYKESVQMLYDNINRMDVSDQFLQSKKEKCLKAFQGILFNKLKMERKRLIEDILEAYPSSIGINSYTSKQLDVLLRQSNHIDSRSVHSYMDMQPTILGEMACLIYGCKLLRDAEDSGRLLTCINNMNYILTLCEKFDMKEIEKVEIEEGIEKSKEDTEENTTSEKSIFLNIYDDRTYVVSANPIDENNIIKSIAINPQKDKFILQCYEHGSVNKITVRFLLEKKREKRYLNGLYPQDQLKEIFVASDETYLAAISLYNQEKFIKLYSTKYISEHSSLVLKGNQVVGAFVDSTEYFLIPFEYINLLPQRLIYDTATPIGKNIKNSYYENDIQILKEIGIVKI